ncbi:hypothetical protein COL27_29440, partial [Bacillus sp. AFS075960]
QTRDRVAERTVLQARARRHADGRRRASAVDCRDRHGPVGAGGARSGGGGQQASPRGDARRSAFHRRHVMLARRAPVCRGRAGVAFAHPRGLQQYVERLDRGR